MIHVLDDLFVNAENETFEDGMDTAFSINLRRIIQYSGVNAVDVLDNILSSNHVNAEIAEEVLRQIGYMNDTHTHRHRLDLLKCQLKSSNSRIRDAASIGISAMDDPEAIPDIQKAINDKRNRNLRQDLEMVLAQLQDTKDTSQKSDDPLIYL